MIKTHLILPKKLLLFTMPQLVKYGVHLGNSKYKWNPGLSFYLHSFRTDICIFNLKYSIFFLRRALTVLSLAIQYKGQILFISSETANRNLTPLLTEFFKKWSDPYVQHEWVGGTLSNWNKNYNIIKKFKTTKKRKRSLDLLFKGLSSMSYLPALAILLNIPTKIQGLSTRNISLKDLVKIDLSVKKYFAKNVAIKDELFKLNIPTIGFVNTDTDLNQILYPIPVNTAYPSAVSLYLNLILYTFEDAKNIKKLGFQNELSNN